MIAILLRQPCPRYILMGNFEYGLLGYYRHDCHLCLFYLISKVMEIVSNTNVCTSNTSYGRVSAPTNQTEYMAWVHVGCVDNDTRSALQWSVTHIHHYNKMSSYAVPRLSDNITLLVVTNVSPSIIHEATSDPTKHCAAPPVPFAHLCGGMCSWYSRQCIRNVTTAIGWPHAYKDVRFLAALAPSLEEKIIPEFRQYANHISKDVQVVMQFGRAVTEATHAAN